MGLNRFTIFTAQFFYAGPTTLALRDVSKIGVKSGAKRDRPMAAGTLDPSAAILNNADPIASIITKDIGTAFAQVSPSAGLACPTGALFSFQERADGAAFQTAVSTNHVTLTSGKGFLHPKSLSADQDKEGGADLELEYAAQYDGTTVGSPAQPNPPWAIASGVALTASVPLFGARWYMGPVYLHATLINAIVGWKIDFGIEYKTKRADGFLYPAIGSITKRLPQLSLKLLDASYASTISSMFNAATAASNGDLNLYLRKGVDGGARVADSVASHAKFAMATGSWAADDFEVSEDDDTMITVPILPTAALTVSVASTIP